MKIETRGAPFKEVTMDEIISFRDNFKEAALYDQISNLEDVKRGSFIRTAIEYYINANYDLE